MNFQEYQANTLCSQYGIPVPAGTAAFSVREALSVADELGGDHWVVKAKAHFVHSPAGMGARMRAVLK